MLTNEVQKGVSITATPANVMQMLLTRRGDILGAKERHPAITLPAVLHAPETQNTKNSLECELNGIIGTCFICFMCKYVYI